jgi:carbon storage regulator
LRNLLKKRSVLRDSGTRLLDGNAWLDADFSQSMIVAPRSTSLCRAPLHNIVAIRSSEGDAMLLLTRKLNEEIRIGANVRVTILEVQGNRVRLGLTAPDDTEIRRGEIFPNQDRNSAARH